MGSCKRIYNVINSLKGGCGKTTLSVWLASYLKNQLPDDLKGDSCILDMDIQGSALVSLLMGESNTNEDYHYLHEWIRGYQIKGVDFIQDITLKKGNSFSVIFASPKQEDKNMFFSGPRSNYTPIIEYGTFRLGINRLLKDDIFRRFKYIIFDMPPNTDGYADSALDCLLNEKYSVVERGQDQVNLFMMMTLDASHRAATINWIQELYTETNNKVPDKLFIVFNKNIVSKYSEDQSLDFCNKAKCIIKEKLDKSKIPQDKKSSIYFLIMNTNTEYSSACIEGMGLAECETDLELEHLPFLKFTSYEGGEFVELDPNELKRLLIGEKDGN